MQLAGEERCTKGEVFVDIRAPVHLKFCNLFFAVLCDCLPCTRQGLEMGSDYSGYSSDISACQPPSTTFGIFLKTSCCSRACMKRLELMRDWYVHKLPLSNKHCLTFATSLLRQQGLLQHYVQWCQQHLCCIKTLYWLTVESSTADANCFPRINFHENMVQYHPSTYKDACVSYFCLKNEGTDGSGRSPPSTLPFPSSSSWFVRQSEILPSPGLTSRQKLSMSTIQVPAFQANTSSVPDVYYIVVAIFLTTSSAVPFQKQ